MTKQKNFVPLLAETQIQPPQNIRFQLKFVTTGLAVQCPAFNVAPGWTVTLLPINGSGVNANPCSVAEDPGMLGTTSARTLPAGSDVSMGWPTVNTANIFASGTAGDGLLVVITSLGLG
jgi:hypothetical protein